MSWLTGRKQSKPILLPYKLKIPRGTKRQQSRLPGNVRQRIKRFIDSLTDNPRPLKTKELRNLPNHYRFRLDPWRVIYQVDDDSETVFILAIRRKTGPETYENLE